MVKYILGLLLLFSCLSHGQITYTSTYTQLWPSIFRTEYQEVKRSITVEAGSITIASQTAGGKDIQELLIQDIHLNDENMVYTCITKDRRKVILIIPPRERIKFIDMYKTLPDTGEEIQLRFLLDRIIFHSTFAY